MKRVIILRHAKTEPAGPGQDDADRHLIEQGRKAAAEMGAYMARKGYVPDWVACSAATRTMETCGILVPAVRENIPVVIRPDLYLAEASHLLSVIRSSDDNLGTVMVIAHNPGVAVLAFELAAAPVDAATESRHRRMREKFSTCSLVVLDFSVKSWTSIRKGKGVLADFMRPRDLERETD